MDETEDTEKLGENHQLSFVTANATHSFQLQHASVVAIICEGWEKETHESCHKLYLFLL
jgi:hypothetical protein